MRATVLPIALLCLIVSIILVASFAVTSSKDESFTVIVKGGTASGGISVTQSEQPNVRLGNFFIPAVQLIVEKPDSGRSGTQTTDSNGNVVRGQSQMPAVLSGPVGVVTMMSQDMPGSSQSQQAVVILGAGAGVIPFVHGSPVQVLSLTVDECDTPPRPLADWRGCNMSSLDLRGADLTAANMRGIFLNGADLTAAVLSHADLTGADLSHAKLNWTSLSDADLRGAVLTNANLTGAILTGTDLSGADLSGADLTDADITDAILDCLNHSICKS